ncbi:hypothetical protein [Hyphomicrobium facile]|uniref:Uncharacterized protein n=1 Tax=Hyphomicrobium facile TaxID=51670 RepID=A0A1I7NQZ4_9HYPH|nr:hypothetical protein [Hyphomicrobium facile]SFV37012.1 hypothetical protein SAMN04488557_2948 [Hyphomicrobium facile]
MFRDNVIWVDFRVSKDIRERQALSFAERLKASPAQSRGHVEVTKTAIEAVRRMLAGSPVFPKHPDKP